MNATVISMQAAAKRRCVMKATVSGSFRRHIAAIYDAVSELGDLGVEVLSPADPRVVDQIGEFVFVASDRVRSIKMVEDRHLECIQASSFLWLVAPDGYVGQSASMELGYAIAHGVPIYGLEVPFDGTLQKYVRRVASMADALAMSRVDALQPADETFLVRPFDAIEQAHAQLDQLRSQLTRIPADVRDSEGEQILEERKTLSRLIAPSSPLGRRASA